MRGVFEKVLAQKSLYEGIKTVYEQGLKFWENGEREKGFQMVCSAFNEDPDNKVVLDAVVRMGYELNRNETLEKSLREYLMYHPVNINTLLLLAETLLNMGKAEPAEEELRKILIFDPGNKKAETLMKNVS